MLYLLPALALLSAVDGAAVKKRATTTSPPDYFQTPPEIFAGPTPTGAAPFLALTNPAPFPGVSYIPPKPLETQEPIKNAPKDGNIFQLLGNIAPYFPSPGFGVDEFPLPEGAEITWMNMISRHGARYPTAIIALGAAISGAKSAGAKFSGDLEWLNDWTYNLGTNILTPSGRQE